jgi:2-polyprenyl-3-methyl-5-hydroxy-6-metoxy-1,4-benzoquinol methylase
MIKECKLCGNTELTLLTKELRRGNGEVWHCPKCDLGMLTPCFDDAKKYYDTEYRKKFTDSLVQPSSDPEAMFELRKKFQDDRINIFKRYWGKDKSLLEIGCSAGQFLTHVQDKLGHCEGVEFDTKCAEYVTKKFGIPVQTKDLKECSFLTSKFDLIAFFQVLEHTSDPVEFLRDVRARLKGKGKIFVEVPNLYDPLMKLWPVEAYQKFYYHEAHTFYFSEKSLKAVLRAAGFGDIKIYWLQDYNLLNNLFWYFNNGPQKDCVFGLSAPHIEFLETGKKAGRQLNRLFVKADREYKKILAKNKLTANMFAVASLK